MQRRAFLGSLAGFASAMLLDPEKALWRPGAKSINIPQQTIFESEIFKSYAVQIEEYFPLETTLWARSLFAMSRISKKTEFCDPDIPMRYGDTYGARTYPRPAMLNFPEYDAWMGEMECRISSLPSLANPHMPIMGQHVPFSADLALAIGQREGWVPTKAVIARLKMDPDFVPITADAWHPDFLHVGYGGAS